MNQETIAPITLEFSVNCSPEKAFHVYTGRIGEWWDAQYTANPDSVQDVTIEPQVGGRVYATHSDMGEHDWGVVSAWEPGRLLVHSFTLAQNPNHATEVSVTFFDEPFSRSHDGTLQACVVIFEHRGWTADNAAARDKFSDWEHILKRFSALVEESR